MASAWILRADRPSGRRYQVRYRPGGRDSRQRYGGTFRTAAEAKARRDWIMGELAAMRMPVLEVAEPELAPTVAEVSATWRASRIDVAPNTREQHEVAIRRFERAFGTTRVDALEADDVIAAIAAMHERGLARGSIRHSLSALAMALDHAGIEPNPARDRRVKLPREDREDVEPPGADAVEAVIGACAPRYRLPLVVLDACGLRVSELEHLRWGDVDEHAGRLRLSQGTTKGRRSLWVDVPPDLFERICALCPREDRDQVAQVFVGFTGDRVRTDLARACRATGTPLWSPHELRHRRLSLWHLAGVPVAEMARRVGQRRLSVTLDTYSHVVMDRREVDREALLA